ncbi:YbjN domain-containing protein [Anabaena sp. CCY 0017]|uniref:YbjN domain-containing protein n=1 Tax=Anabaena sp. CCY 0017 TaxID=3103866 RepID=UPI0039C5B0D0
MEVQTKNHQLNSELILYDSSCSSLTVHTITLSLTKQDDNIIECHLTFCITCELYQRIETEALFNLKPELSTPLSNGDFQPSPDIQIEAILKPDLLPLLLENATNADEAAAYILELSQQQPGLTSETEKNNKLFKNPKSPYSLLYTESWLALSVKQQQESGETGYRTFWSYVSPQTLTGEAASSEQISESITNFFQDLVSDSLNITAKEFANETIGAISNFFQELTQDTPEDNTSTQPIFQAIINFLTQDDWPFTKIQGKLALRLGFQGKNGKWNCYAEAREEEEQFVFYSICPQNASESQHMAIAEFITRANFGIVIGNFEMDFNDGEIRYKTSIDVEGDRVSFALIKQLVYANIATMDEYLPDIMSVISGDVSTEKAINQIELTPDIPPDSEEQEQLLSVVPAENQQNLAVNPSPQAEIQQEPEKQPHILAKLTPDEIGQLHQALQMLEPYQRKQTQEIIEKVKRLIITRLGNLGTEVFDEAFSFFTKVKFPGIILKLIQRYAKMAGRTRLFIQQLKDRAKQSGEPFDNSEINLAIEDLEKLFAKIDKRLEELPTDKLLGDKELIYLLEIEQFNEQLAFFERLIKNLSENPDPGLASTP